MSTSLATGNTPDAGGAFPAGNSVPTAVAYP